MKSISTGRSKSIFTMTGSWSPVSGNTAFCVHGRQAASVYRMGAAKGVRQHTLTPLPSFTSFAFKTVPLCGQEGLAISAHLDGDSPLFEATWKVYLSAFCDFERRDREDQRKIMAHPRYRFSAVLREGVPVGLLSWWVLDGFVFVEHFAIAAEARSGGLGGRALALLQAHVGVPVVVDVEPRDSEDEQAARRVAFYQRQGFHYCADAVTLPPYRGKGTAPSNLMAYPSALDAAARAQCLAAIEHGIYGIVDGLCVEPLGLILRFNPCYSVSGDSETGYALTMQRKFQKRGRGLSCSLAWQPQRSQSCIRVPTIRDESSFNERRSRGESSSDA